MLSCSQIQQGQTPSIYFWLLSRYYTNYLLMQQYEVQIVYWVITQYLSTASWWTSLELGQEAIYNNQIISVRP
jgi:hypothetical protein